MRRGMSSARFGLIALAVLAACIYLGVTKSVPFRSHYEIQAVFANSNLIDGRSPVRIAGVDVGKVVRVERYRDSRLALVTMRIVDAGRPVHADATLKVRPRLFLEGNFFVELEPGTPAGGELPDGGMIPVAQTAAPVQLDQLLSTLDSDVRGSLQRTITGFGDALGARPTAAEDRAQDPAVRGTTGAQALNRTLATSGDALRGTAVVGEALQGEQRDDLSRMIAGFARAAAALAEREHDLSALVRDFNATMATTAAHGAELEQTVRRLGPAATNARRAFASLERALPPTRRFAGAFAPAMRELPETMRLARPWLAQAAPLLGEDELGGLLAELQPATAALASLTAGWRTWFPRIDRFNRCVTDVLIPTGNVKVDDGPLSAGVENYKEFWHAMVGSASESQGFDGNGPILRLQAPGGVHPIRTGVTNFSREALVANAAFPPLRTRPAYPNKVPPLRRDVPCHTSPVPDVNGPASTGPADGSRPNAPPPRGPDG
jgi:phospholipid/cholesterol/gamma-HCH transport system substrate-binding protein